MKIARQHQTIKHILISVTIIISLSACSNMRENIKGNQTPDYTVPFSISFDKKGTPIIFDQNGERMQPTPVEFPVKAKEIKSLQTVTVMEVKGSCFWIVQSGGKTYQIPLPDSYCD